MGQLIDLTGQRFGRLTVLRRAGTYKSFDHQIPTWLCRCDCGNYAVIKGNALKIGATKSCGCLRRETSSKNMKLRHALAKQAMTEAGYVG